MNANTDNSLIIGLKTQVSRQVGLKLWEANVANYNQSHLLNSWKLLYVYVITNYNNNDELTEMIWDYVTSAPFKIFKKMKSNIFGIYTTIGDYINKKGVTSQAHYTDKGNYIGSVSKLGNKPIVYECYFAVKRDSFTIDFTALPNLKEINEDLFQPIPVVL